MAGLDQSGWQTGGGKRTTAHGGGGRGSWTARPFSLAWLAGMATSQGRLAKIWLGSWSWGFIRLQGCGWLRKREGWAVGVAGDGANPILAASCGNLVHGSSARSARACLFSFLACWDRGLGTSNVTRHAQRSVYYIGTTYNILHTTWQVFSSGQWHRKMHVSGHSRGGRRERNQVVEPAGGQASRPPRFPGHLRRPSGQAPRVGCLLCGDWHVRGCRTYTNTVLLSSYGTLSRQALPVQAGGSKEALGRRWMRRCVREHPRSCLCWAE